MKPIVRNALLLSLLVTWAVAVAQAPPDSEPAAVAAADEQALEEDPGESPPDAELEEEEAPDVEASADEVFKPGDEISEDYPVPLPSDM